MLATTADTNSTDRATDLRRHPRVSVDVPATLDVAGFRHPVSIVDISRGGVACARAPYLEADWVIDVTVDRGGRDQRFVARVVWRRDDGDDGYAVGLEFVRPVVH